MDYRERGGLDGKRMHPAILMYGVVVFPLAQFRVQHINVFFDTLRYPAAAWMAADTKLHSKVPN